MMRNSALPALTLWQELFARKRASDKVVPSAIKVRQVRVETLALGDADWAVAAKTATSTGTGSHSCTIVQNPNSWIAIQITVIYSIH